MQGGDRHPLTLVLALVTTGIRVQRKKVRGSLCPALRSHKKGSNDTRSDDWFGFLISVPSVEINWLIPRNSRRSLRLAELVGNQTYQWRGAWLVLEAL